MSEPRLIRVPGGRGIDPRIVRGVLPIDVNDDYPELPVRVVIFLDGGANQVVKGFSTIQGAWNWATQFMDEVNASRGDSTSTYEYRVVRHSDPDYMEEELNNLAQEGWRLVSATFDDTRHVAYLERKLSGGTASC